MNVNENQSVALSDVVFTIEQVNAAIDAISKSQARVASAIGKVALMALYFANVKSDVGAANALINSLRKSTKKDGLIALLETHGNMVYAKIGKKDPSFVEFNAGKGWTKDEVRVYRADCAQWENFKPETAGNNAIDVVDKVTKLVTSVKKAIKEDAGNVKHADLIDAVNLALANYTAALADAGEGE